MDEIGNNNSLPSETNLLDSPRLTEYQFIEYATYLAGLVLGTMVKIDCSNATFSINEMRVLNRIFMRDYVKNRPITVSELSDDLQIPISTVSKLVSRNMEVGIITDSVDEFDGRRRLLRFTAEATVTNQEWATMLRHGLIKARNKGYPICIPSVIQ